MLLWPPLFALDLHTKVEISEDSAFNTSILLSEFYRTHQPRMIW
jgi:hypothetical protein